jgi:hypothetical protein
MISTALSVCVCVYVYVCVCREGVDVMMQEEGRQVLKSQRAVFNQQRGALHLSLSFPNLPICAPVGFLVTC